MNSGNSAINFREEYRNAKLAFMLNGYTEEQIDGARLSQSYIRLEQLLTTTKNVYNFPVLDNDSTKRITEKRLFQQDAFYASSVQIYLCKAASATSAAMLMSTYPSPIIFSTSGAAAALETFYNGQWSFKQNNDDIITGFDLMQFRQVRQTQLTAATNSPADQFDGTDNVVLSPNPVFNGQKKNNFVINLPDVISALDANVYAVVILRGILAQNVTVVS